MSIADEIDVAKLPPQIRALWPKLVQVYQAVDQSKRGEQITARCYTCGEILQITHIEPISSVWVQCGNGCTNMHFNGGHSAPSERTEGK